jgi:hypothetical protein
MSRYASEPALSVSIAKSRRERNNTRLFRISANPPPLQHQANRGDQFVRSVTQNKIRAGNFGRMKAHLQNRQAGIVLVHSVGNFPLFHSSEAVANKGQVDFFTGFTQGLNLRQSQRGANSESFVFQQQSSSCVEHFTGRNRQNFGHEGVLIRLLIFPDYTLAFGLNSLVH